MEMVPPVMSSRPAIIRSAVDFPQPDGPTRTMNSRSWISRSSPSMTLTGPKRFVTCLKITEAIWSVAFWTLRRDSVGKTHRAREGDVPRHAMTPEAHAAFAAALLKRLEADPDVLGLVFLGSSSGEPPAPDAFSDHDLFVVTRPGAQERFRTDLSWLPNAADLVLSFRE